MASTRRDFLHDRMTGGIDISTPSHLLDPSVWRDARGFRTYLSEVSQIPYLVRVGQLPSASNASVIINLPVDDEGQVLYVLLDKNKVRQLYPSAPASSVTLLYEDGSLPSFVDAVGVDRWSHCLYAGQVWFSSRFNKLHYTDGAKVGTYTTDLPKARFVESYFDHIVAANAEFQGMVQPYTLRWSHLYDPSQWVPTPTNEADYFDVTEWVRGEEVVGGITGLRKQGDRLIVYTESSIIGCQYVGLPKVMQLAPIVLDSGCGFYHSLISYRGMHYYLDRANRNFYRFDGRAATPIGDKVVRGLLAGNMDFGSIANGIRSFIVPEKNEVWWHVPAYAGSVFIYNWVADAWTIHASYFDIGGGALQCTSHGGYRARTCDELTSTCDSQTGTANQLNISGESALPRIYSESLGYLLRDEIEGDVNTEGDTFGAFQYPYLETGDRYFGSLNQVKEVDGITIDADYYDNLCNGILVEVSVRERLADTVVWTKAGVWHKGLKDNFLSFPKRLSGKIFRWKFSPQRVAPLAPRGVIWRAFTEHVYGAQAER